MYKKTCVICGAEFYTTHSNFIVCPNPECKKERMRIRAKELREEKGAEPRKKPASAPAHKKICKKCEWYSHAVGGMCAYTCETGKIRPIPAKDCAAGMPGSCYKPANSRKRKSSETTGMFNKQEYPHEFDGGVIQDFSESKIINRYCEGNND